MSFYMATCFDDKIMVASDGAGYYRDGTIASFSQKIHVVEGFPIAIVTRGEVSATSYLVAKIEEIIRTCGSLEVAMKLLGDKMPDYRQRTRDPVEAEICIAGVTVYGPTIFHFRTQAEEGFVEPFKLYESHKTILCGVENDGYHYPNDGPDYFKKYAVAVIDFFREREAAKGKTYVGSIDDCCVFGGHVDVATITADGVTVERVHTWSEDQVGMTISPKAKEQKVVPMAAHKHLNRKQRRAAGLTARKARVA